MAQKQQQPSHDELDDLMLSCRYGDLDDVQVFVEKFGKAHLSQVRDERGNTVLHMICANGHLTLLNYLLPLVDGDLLAVANTSGKNTPLHWAATNQHLDIAKALVSHPQGPGVLLIDAKNAAGLTPLGEAATIEWEEGAAWFAATMNLDTDKLNTVEVDEEGDVDMAESTPQVQKLSTNTSTMPQRKVEQGPS